MRILRAHFTCLGSGCGLCGLVLSSSQHRRRPCSLTFSSQTCAPAPTLEKHSLLLSEFAAEWQAQLTTHHSWLAPAEAWDRRGQERSPSPSLFTPSIGQLLALPSIMPFPNPLHSHLSHKTRLLSSRSCHSPSVDSCSQQTSTSFFQEKEKPLRGKALMDLWPSLPNYFRVDLPVLHLLRKCHAPSHTDWLSAVLLVSAHPHSSGGLF